MSIISKYKYLCRYNKSSLCCSYLQTTAEVDRKYVCNIQSYLRLYVFFSHIHKFILGNMLNIDMMFGRYGPGTAG